MFDINIGGLLFYLVNHQGWNYLPTLILFLILSIIASYLLGSINTALVISKVFYKDDIRRHGSGNAGLTNMLRTYGKGAALGTLIGDMLKTAIAILLTGSLLGFYYMGGMSAGDGYCYVAGLCAVIGHIFPIYYKFKGGKGVLVTATMALILAPIPFAILLLIFIIAVCASKYVSLGSVIGGVLFPVVIRAYTSIMNIPLGAMVSASAIALAVIIVWCHRENLERISQRTERKLSFGKKDKDESD